MMGFNRMLAGFFCFLIRGYQIFLSPFLGHRCRFDPTCSAYALTAIRVYGAGRGLKMTALRMGRCHPWGGFGYDPVEENPTKKT